MGGAWGAAHRFAPPPQPAVGNLHDPLSRAAARAGSGWYTRGMQADVFDEEDFFRAIARSGARVLLIGRRALIALGLPVVTRDYDFWLHIDDVSTFNDAVVGHDLYPSVSPDEARRRGRYVLENDEHVDVLIARAVPTVDGERVAFDDVWRRRRCLEAYRGVAIAVPCIDDLIRTKRFGARPRDLEDIRQLEMLRQAEQADREAGGVDA